jgi:acetyl-CoA synthetase
MPWEPIHKFSQNWDLPPNLLDYDQTYAAFSWETVRRDLDGLPGGRGLNMAHEAVDRYANGARRDHLALRWLGKDGSVRDLTYGDLQEQSNRFANVLASLGVAKGERVFRFCRKFSFKVICGMVSPSNPCCQGGERRWRSASKGPIFLTTLF